ncbi:MAG: glycosyltransferase [Patescibacteria group bacterium]
MRILIFGLDKTLLNNRGDKVGGDALSRHIKYAQSFDHIDVVVPTKKGFQKSEPDPKLTLWPTNSKHAMFYLWDLFFVARKITKSNYVSLIVSQEATFLGLVAWILSRKIRVPLLAHFHGDVFVKKPETRFPFVAKILAKFIARRAFRIRCVSQLLKEKLINMGIREEKIRVISTPVDLDQFAMADEKKVQKIKEKFNNKKIILFVGRFVPIKNLPFLVDAFYEVSKKISDVVLALVGSGQEEDALKEKVKTLGLEGKVFFEGEIGHDALPAYYVACDIFALTSTSEAFGKVLVEAAMAQKPAVSAVSVGPKEIIVDGENGFLINQGDISNFSEKLVYLLMNNEARIRMGQKAKTLVQERYGKNHEKIINFWQEIVSKYKITHPLKVLMVTRKVDKDDALAGFTYRWIKEISLRVSKLEVICLEKGNSSGLPENVSVNSMGKEKGRGRLSVLFHYIWLLIKILPKVGVVFSHQNPEYAGVAGPLACLFGKKIVIWYTHGSVPFHLRFAEFWSSAIMTASSESFRLKTKKPLYVMGHGVADEFFKVQPHFSAENHHLLAVGRLSPRKNYETLLLAIKKLKEENFSVKLDIIGEEGLASQKDYAQYLHDFILQNNLQDAVKFLGAVPNSDMPKTYSKYNLLVHPSLTGSLDKVVLEAASSGLAALTSGQSYNGLQKPFANILTFPENNSDILAEKIKSFMNLPAEKKQEISKYIIKFIKDNHSLEKLSEKIEGVLEMFRD